MADTVEVPSRELSCPQCGALLRTDARFCGMCGTRLPADGHFEADTLIGKVVAAGTYRIDGVLGTGSMGVVYRAEDLTTGRRVALKVISEKADDETSRARFRREARAASQLAHPNVVQVFEYGQLDGGQPFIAMELLEGRTLEELIEEEFPIALNRLIDIMRDVLAALDAAHAQHILHRDLKPANVFITRLSTGREEAKVLDFGVATALDHSMTASKTWAPLTEAGFVCGTPAFMSPEQVQGFELDQRSDLFSAAGVLYQGLTQERPFPGRSPVEVGANIVLKRLVPPSACRPDLRLPRVVDEFFEQAMAKAADERFASAKAMSAALDQVYRAMIGPGARNSLELPAPPPATMAFRGRGGDDGGDDDNAATMVDLPRLPVSKTPDWVVEGVADGPSSSVVVQSDLLTKGAPQSELATLISAAPAMRQRPEETTLVETTTRLRRQRASLLNWALFGIIAVAVLVVAVVLWFTM